MTPPRKPFFKSKHFLITIAMASILSLTLLSLLLFFSLSSATHRRHQPPTSAAATATIPPEIHQACKATRNPDTCESSLTRSEYLNPSPNPIQIIQTAIWVSAQNLKTAQSMAQSILQSASGNPNRTTAAKSCIEVLGYSAYRTQSTAEKLPRGGVKDSRAWMSAALLYQYDCWSALKYVNDTNLVNDTMSFLDSLTSLTSNALSMLVSYDIYGENTSLWKPPGTERTGSWEAASGGGLGTRGGFPAGLVADVVVCKDGSGGCYGKIQEAVDVAPSNNGEGRFVIWIKEGVYEETVRVGLEKKNVVFLGDGMGKTVITGSLNVGQVGVSTYSSATVGVVGDGFMASGLTIQNTAGPDAHQAVAFRSDSDLSIIENCEFLGNQDTLYARSLRQFYKSCRIQGNVDFIFGNSASIFQDCHILVAPRQLRPEKGENNAISAHGRTDPAQSTGYVFQNCVINGTEDYVKFYLSNPKVHKNYLGRPWKEYSRSVYINCVMESIISAPGWMPWSGDFALSTLFYGEFGNSGAGAGLSGRVLWSSQIPAEHVNVYSVQNFIQGDQWIPTT